MSDDPVALKDLIIHFWLYTGEFEIRKMTEEQRALFWDVIDEMHLRDYPDE